MQDTELYIHIPFCVRKCLYCDFLSGPFDAEVRKKYTDALIKELHYQSAFMQDDMIRSIYFGGGTPTLLEEAYFEKIISEVFQDFHIKENAEISMECNPATASLEKLSHYCASGVNRLSIGLQSANDDELITLGRIHTFEDFLHTYEEAGKAGFSNINIDIMTGIPGQSWDTLRNTLTQVTDLRPEHISCYSLIIEENTPFYQSYHEEDERRREGEPVENYQAHDENFCGEVKHLPSDDEEYALSKNARDFLISKGYGQYEISNYARKGYECIHNIGYWQRVPYFGAGPGAASLLKEVRYKNPTDIKKYIEKAENNEFPIYEIKEELTKNAAMEEFIFLGLRMNEGISIEKFKENFGSTIESIYSEQIKKFQEEKLLEISDGRLKFTERGMDVSNYVLSEFLLGT